MRPIVVLDISEMKYENFKGGDETLVNAANYCLRVVTEYMLFDGYVESAVVLLNINNRSLADAPISIIGALVRNLTDNFPNFVCKTILLNPSTSLKLGWKVVE